MKLWYAMQTMPRHEFRVNDRLVNRNFETFLPTYTEHKQWKKCRTVDISVPLFPSYLFVCTSLADRHTILGTPGVVTLLGLRGKPLPVDASVIDTLRLGLRDRDFLPHFVASLGESVKIVRGPLRGLEGRVVRVKSQLRVVIHIDWMPNSVTAEVYEHELAPVDSIRALVNQSTAINSQSEKEKTRNE